MTSITTVIERLQGFVAREFPLARSRQLGVDDPLIDSGIVDSLGVLKLVGFIETEFGIEVIDDDLMPDNFGTIRSVGNLVLGKLQATGSWTHDGNDTARRR